MKKTLIALLSLASVASAATLANIDTTDQALESYFNYSTGNAQTAGDIINWNELMTWNETSLCGTTGASNSMYTDGGMKINMKDDGGFTISFDINNVTKTGTILSMLVNHQNCTNAESDSWRTMKVDIARNDTTNVYTLSTLIGNKTLSVDIGSTLSWTTLTIVGTANTEGVTQNKDLTMDLDVYVNGNLSGSYSDFGAWNFIAEDLTKLQFGYFGNSANNTQLDIDNILIYSRPLDAEEVKGLVIPEPTTATLSLLALAGLVARRRRK